MSEEKIERLTNGSYVSEVDTVHGNIYWVLSRNLCITIYNAYVQGFVGVREKFHDRYLFTEYHFDTGPPFGTVKPKADLGLCPLKNLLSSEEWESSELMFKYLDFLEELYNKYDNLDMLEQFTGSGLEEFLDNAISNEGEQ